MKNKHSLSSLLYSKKFLMVVSVLLAFVIWGMFSIYKSPETQQVIKGVPVTIDMGVPNQLGYEAFGTEKNMTVDVTVQAKRYLFADKTMKAENFKAVAITSNVSRPGAYSLNIKVTPPSDTNNIKIISKSIDSISVYFDVPSTKEYKIEPVLKNTNIINSNTDFLVDTPVLSEEKVTIKGPASEMGKIKTVSAVASVQEQKKESFTLNPKFEVKDSSGNDINYLSYNIDVDNIFMTVPIYKILTLPTGATFENAPAYYVKNPIKYEINPKTIRVGVLSGIADKAKTADLVKIDFSSLHGGVNTFVFDENSIADGFKLLDENQKINVKVNVGNVKSKELQISPNNIKFNNLKPKTKAKILSNNNVKIIILGPATEIADLETADIMANIDLKNADVGTHTFPISIGVKKNYCWAYGKYQSQVIIENAN
ncbi:MAG: hypothetical protein Q4E28_02760 [Clostridia bacterium]|nr:hypothetical protein [Clostridia bacterium]